MKKIILLFLLLVSCTKDEQSIHCWYCETFSNGVVIIKTEIENMSPDEIIGYQKGFSSGIEHCIKSNIETICIKKESQ